MTKKYKADVRKFTSLEDPSKGWLFWVYENGLVCDGVVQYYTSKDEYRSSLDCEVSEDVRLPDGVWEDTAEEMIECATFHSLEAAAKLSALLTGT